jgi:hypothetical protein
MNWIDYCRLFCRVSQEIYQGEGKQFHIREGSADVNICVIKKRHLITSQMEILSV